MGNILAGQGSLELAGTPVAAFNTTSGRLQARLSCGAERATQQAELRRGPAPANTCARQGAFGLVVDRLVQSPASLAAPLDVMYALGPLAADGAPMAHGAARALDRLDLQGAFQASSSTAPLDGGAAAPAAGSSLPASAAAAAPARAPAGGAAAAPGAALPALPPRAATRLPVQVVPAILPGTVPYPRAAASATPVLLTRPRHCLPLPGLTARAHSAAAAHCSRGCSCCPRLPCAAWPAWSPCVGVVHTRSNAWTIERWALTFCQARQRRKTGVSRAW